MTKSSVDIAFSRVGTQPGPEEIFGMLASVFIIIIKEHTGRGQECWLPEGSASIET